MTGQKSTRRVYSADELHRLRNSVSQPRLHEAIEEHDGEDAELVKEHVLRGSKSFAARSWRSRADRPSANSLHVPSNKENRSTNASDSERHPSGGSGPLASKAGLVLGEIAANNQAIRPAAYRPRPSPTPSLRKQKIESLVKAHGSPTHVRVTAGGRIVPKEQSPLCHPRFGYSAVKVNGGLIKFAPNNPMGKTQWTQATQNGFVAQDVNGRLCQIVDGTILPLNEIDGALQLFMPAPNLNITQRGPSQGAIPGRFGLSSNQQRQASRAIPPEPPASAQINALELEYSKLEHELKDVDKTEVLHGRTMGKAAKDALIAKRRELVVSLDKVRKALKSLRQQPPADAPTSPRAMLNRKSMSPRSRLPAFLQHRQQQSSEVPVQPAPPALYGPFFPAAQPFAVPYGYQATPSPDTGFPVQPWIMPAPAIFVPPPPFDGSLSSASLPFAQTLNPAATAQSTQPAEPSPGNEPRTESGLPQNDGARSYADLQKVASPTRSHALPIKAPERKIGTGTKSSLNPMSPAYKPGNGVLQSQDGSASRSIRSDKTREPTPLSNFHQLQPPSKGQLRVANPTDETISPTKKNTDLASSSVSSFETADFFPRNTRHYSTRRHAYPAATDKSDDKENIDPTRRDSTQDDDLVIPDDERNAVDSKPNVTKSDFRTQQPLNGALEAPAAPPGTPVNPELASRLGNLPFSVDVSAWERQSHGFDIGNLPDREANNLSPKNKRRGWVFIEEDPAQQYRGEVSSSPEKFHACQDELCVTSSPYDTIDFTKKPREWVEGYQAGLNRDVVGADRAGDFLDGYCSGLLKSKPTASLALSTGSPVKPASRRPSPATRQSSNALQIDRRGPVATRPALAPLETRVTSMDTLKQAVFAPHNENAILTPAADGPHVNESPFNLGGWAKKRTNSATLSVGANNNNFGAFQFPQRTSSMIQRQANRCSDDKLGPKNETLATIGHGKDASSSDSRTALLKPDNYLHELPPLPNSPMSSTLSVAPDSIVSGSINHRVSSMTSVDSNLYRQWPGHRVISPNLEWKSASSVAHHAGLANGFFAHAQFDGISEQWASARCTSFPSVTHAHPAAETQPAPQQASSGNNNGPARYYGRFKENSLDGITNPPTSPQPMSPIATPAKDTSKPSPVKSSSPARAKFEHIAEKVGIKTTAAGKDKEPAEPSSPSGKRRWRDVWRGPRKEASREETS